MTEGEKLHQTDKNSKQFKQKEGIALKDEMRTGKMDTT